jgi:F-type H+-transporting ATPase subunit beta
MAETKERSPMNVGRIVRVVGPVIDVEFAPDAIPAIHTALTVDGETAIGEIHLVAEVQQHLPGNVVRAVAMSSTDGITRGMDAVDTGAPIQMPVGPSTLGRIWNVVGEPVDGKPMPEVEDYYPIHREAPEYESLEPKTEVWARPSSSWSSSTTSPSSTAAPRCSPAWVSAPVRAPTSTTRCPSRASSRRRR